MRAFAVFFLSLPPLLCLAENWPGWRGPRGDGSSLDRHVPLRWSNTNNIVWKTAIPGRGHSSPIVWGERIFLLTAIEEKQQRCLVCLDSQSGQILWLRVVVVSPLEQKHKLNNYASSTPATDGALVYVTFLNQDKMLAATYDFDGNQRWLVHPGVFSSKHGFCSSPVLFKDKVIINGDHDGDAYLVALDRQTGKTLWKIDRENKTRSYCTPIIREWNGKTQMILSGNKCVASYDPHNGQRHWIIDGPTEQMVASVVYNEKADKLFVTGGFPELHILGINPHGHGNVTASHIAWRASRGVSYVPSPVSIGDYFIVVNEPGMLTCYRATDGQLVWSERVGGTYHASLVTAHGLVFCLSDQGVTTIVKPGPDFQVIARNELAGKFFASPAVSNGRIFLRGERDLFCIGSP